MKLPSLRFHVLNYRPGDWSSVLASQRKGTRLTEWEANPDQIGKRVSSNQSLN